MIQRILFVLGAIAWLFFTFLAGLYLTFPTTAAKERLEYEFGKAYKNEYALSVGDLSLWRFSGAALEDVTFYSVKRGRKSKDNPDPAHVRTPMLHLDALYARAAILPSLMGKKAVAFVAEIPGGALDGQYSESAESIELAFDASGIDLSKIPVSTEELSLNLLGSIQGEADLSFDTTDVKKSTGFLKLSFDGFGLGPNSGMGGFQLPEVTFSKAGAAFEVKEGKLEVTEGEFTSDTLNATLSGDIVLNKKLVRSRNRLELSFSLPEELDKLAQIAPDLKRSRDNEGNYHMAISGTILSPSMRFSRSSSRASKDRDEGEGPLASGGSGVSRADMSDEERRAAREERIRERRERLRKRREEADAGNPLNQPGGKERDMPEFEPEDGPNPEDMQDNPTMPRFPPDGGPMGGPGDGPMDGPIDGPGDGPMDFPEEQ